MIKCQNSGALVVSASDALPAIELNRFYFPLSLGLDNATRPADIPTIVWQWLPTYPTVFYRQWTIEYRSCVVLFEWGTIQAIPSVLKVFHNTINFDFCWKERFTFVASHMV